MDNKNKKHNVYIHIPKNLRANKCVKEKSKELISRQKFDLFQFVYLRELPRQIRQIIYNYYCIRNYRVVYCPDSGGKILCFVWTYSKFNAAKIIVEYYKFTNGKDATEITKRLMKEKKFEFAD